MKHTFVSYTTRALMIFTLIQILSNSVTAQTSYSINSNSPWSTTLPSTCYACTINIGSAATLTIDEDVTCQNCTFVGGSISMASHTLNLQYSGSVTTTNFNNTSLTANGSATITVNAPLALSNSTFTLNGTSSMTTSYNVSLTSSTIYLNGNAAMTTNGGSSTAISLMSSSRVVIGDGSKGSKAIFTVSGPTLTIYDNSSVAVANQNNVFYNWSNYNYQKNDNANANSAKSYSTSGLGMNCGAGYANSCSNPSLYGPATLASGVSSSVTLPVILDGVTAMLNNNHTITLDWNTQQEVNFSHFTIERSGNGTTWEAIGTVEAKGNSAVQTDYTFTDQQPLTGTNYYRLALVNLDDTYTYSEQMVLQNTTVARISFFPNPARDYVNVSLGGAAGSQVTVLLTSISGRLMQEKTAVAGNGAVVSFPIQSVASGMYILTVISNDGTRESSPVMISRS